MILVEIFIVWRCIRAAQKARDVSGAMIAYGVAILLFFQGMANIAVNLKLISCFGLAASIHQLWRKRFGIAYAGRWIGRKCCNAA